jgi:hypothetical protein
MPHAEFTDVFLKDSKPLLYRHRCANLKSQYAYVMERVPEQEPTSL